MKLWVDDIRPAPDGYIWCKSVDEAKECIEYLERKYDEYKEGNFLCNAFLNPYDITLIDIDHDAGDYFCYGGDYIKLLDWLEARGGSYAIHIHSMNPVGVQNMRAIIQKNGWTEV